MADWKQITARIRRARTGKDPAGQLSNLYQKTRDAMVAFELAKHFESSGQSSEAAKWYATAAQRFRRADWKSKAQEAAVRLGGAPAVEVASNGEAEAAPQAAEASSEPVESIPPMVVPEPTAPFVETATTFETIVASDVGSSTESAGPANSSTQTGTRNKRRHRGRRGGRNRREGAVRQGAAPEAATSTVQRQPMPPSGDVTPESRFTRVSESVTPSRITSEAPETSAPSKARFGDPGLSSRLSVLEMQFRRLLSCPPIRLDEPDRAPAGPGVLLLSDSELTTHYFVEDCQTLRIAVASLLRGNSSRRGATALKPKLAEHLGIAESRVSKYLTEHCVVRYLQLDEGASYFAHFVIAVLHPVLND